MEKHHATIIIGNELYEYLNYLIKICKSSPKPNRLTRVNLNKHSKHKFRLGGGNTSGYVSKEIEALISNITSKHEILANKIRVLILSIILMLNEAKWNDIKIILNKLVGPINPNTIAFHLKKLIEAKWVIRGGSVEAPKYIAHAPEDVEKELKELINYIKRTIERG